ncbi:unnamed protein product, partial [Brassica rapa subsp. narinosa]
MGESHQETQDPSQEREKVLDLDGIQPQKGLQLQKNPSDDTLEKLPLRKRQKTSPLNKGDDLFTQKESVEEADELNTLTTITQKLFNLIEERETRQKQEAEQREAEKKKNNL